MERCTTLSKQALSQALSIATSNFASSRVIAMIRKNAGADNKKDGELVFLKAASAK